MQSTKPKIRYRFIYTSHPDRGLAQLLQIFPSLRQVFPNATLFVATYAPEAVGDDLATQMSQMVGYVQYAGSLSKQELYQQILLSEVCISSPQLTSGV